MKRRLWLLNIVLLAVAGIVGWRLREAHVAARARERQILRASIPAAPAPPFTPVPATPPVQAASYFDIAQKMLFAKERHPNVVIEPPAPKPVPPFPAAFGVMDLGDGPMVILAEKDKPQRGYKAGEKIGEFVLAEVGREQLVFEWDGKKFPKKLEDLVDRGAPSRNDGGQAASTPRTPSGPPPAAVAVKAGPGTDMGGGYRACVAGDTTPPGTVVDGMKKITSPSPFGTVCRWEAAK